jgi:SAM-dependent methyltransferase
MDGQDLDLPSEHFDAACSVFGLMYFPDHRAGLAEVRRVLKPGGRVGIAVWESPSRMGHLRVWEQAARRICYPATPTLPRPAAWLQMESPEGLRRELETAGFRDVSVTKVAHGWEVPSARWFLENADASQPLCERLGLGLEARELIREAVLALLDDEYGDGPFSLISHAHIGLATR